MDVTLKTEFEVVEEGSIYTVPTYRVEDGGLRLLEKTMAITFVRGSKDPNDKIDRVDGTLHEHLLAMMIHDLKFKNNLLPSRETAIVITKLEEALQWTWARQIDRAKREVLGTYQK